MTHVVRQKFTIGAKSFTRGQVVTDSAGIPPALLARNCVRVPDDAFAKPAPSPAPSVTDKPAQGA